MKKILLLLICMSCFKSNQFESNIYTNIRQLQKYIDLPVPIQNAKYEISIKKLRDGAQDCNEITEIYAILEFSEQDYIKIIELANEKYNFPLVVNKDYCRDWYPNYIKEYFIEDSKELYKIASSYEGHKFLKENIIGNVIYFPTQNNTICYIISICSNQ